MKTRRLMSFILIAGFGILVTGICYVATGEDSPSTETQTAPAAVSPAPSTPDIPPAGIEAIDRIAKLPAVILRDHRKLTQYPPIQAEVADIPSASDMRLRFRQETSEKQFEYYMRTIKGLLQDRWITPDTRNNLVTIRDWPYFKMSSVVTKYQTGDCVIQIRDNNYNTVVVICTSPDAASKVFTNPQLLAQRVVELYKEFIRPSQRRITVEEVINNKFGRFTLMPDGKTGEIWGRCGDICFWSDGDTLYVRKPKTETNRGSRLKSAGSIAKGLLPPSPLSTPVTMEEDDPQETEGEPIEIHSDEPTEEESENKAN